MIEILRNLGRRKLRSALTISGIVIGIFALMTMGALAEHFNAMLGYGESYFATSIRVGAPYGQQTALIPLDTATTIGHIPGVAAVYPTYEINARPGGEQISFGPPDMITNEHPGAAAFGAPAMPIAAGRDLAPDARGEVVLGQAMAVELNAQPGSILDLPIRPADAGPDFATHPFTVVGVLGSIGAGLDSTAYVSEADAQLLLADTLPPAVRTRVDTATMAQGFQVFAPAGTSLADLDTLAARITAQVPGVQAQQPSAAVASFQATGSTFTAVLTGAALLALLIGGLSVVNTMLMAVGERVREIGLKKAVGARSTRVLREFLLEAVTIGALGGAIGFLLGLGLTSLINAGAGADPVFLVTPRLTALAIGFAVGMAALAGLVPAVRAARLDPVRALRSF
jgi:putative ABC transport system permease protein